MLADTDLRTPKSAGRSRGLQLSLFYLSVYLSNPIYLSTISIYQAICDPREGPEGGRWGVRSYKRGGGYFLPLFLEIYERTFVFLDNFDIMYLWNKNWPCLARKLIICMFGEWIPCIRMTMFHLEKYDHFLPLIHTMPSYWLS